MLLNGQSMVEHEVHNKSTAMVQLPITSRIGWSPLFGNRFSLLPNGSQGRL